MKGNYDHVGEHLANGLDNGRAASIMVHAEGLHVRLYPQGVVDELKMVKEGRRTESDIMSRIFQLEGLREAF